MSDLAAAGTTSEPESGELRHRYPAGLTEHSKTTEAFESVSDSASGDLVGEIRVDTESESESPPQQFVSASSSMSNAALINNKNHVLTTSSANIKRPLNLDKISLGSGADRPAAESPSTKKPRYSGFIAFLWDELTHGYDLHNDPDRYSEKRRKVYAFIQVCFDAEAGFHLSDKSKN